MSYMDLSSQDRAMAAIAGASNEAIASPSSALTGRENNIDTHENITLKLPRSAYLIIFVEGCERFCFYGLRAILLLYFMHFLSLNKDSATADYHLFSFACHFTPTLGAIISDGFIGRYLTILILSIIYFIGTFILTITAIPNIGHGYLIGPIFSLLLIAFGTGGIKPCVSTFGADQVSMSNSRQLSRYFSFFYFAINIGSLFSMIITPLLRSQVDCFGYDCYALAFGIPSLLMLIAIILFIAGTPLYKRVPPKDNIIVQFIAIILRAIRNAIFSSRLESKKHWLYYADDKYSTNNIEDVRSVLHVFALLAPLSIYQALYNQQGSRWTYQASLMDGSLGPFGTIQPDQMQSLNCILILLFLPLFEQVIYPAAARFNWFIKPLQRIFFGLILMIISFFVAAILQEAIHKKAEAVPVRYYTNIYNGYNCSVYINSTQILESGKIQQFPCTNLLNEELFIKSTCDEQSVYYKLPEDKLCPSILIISEVDDQIRGKEMELTPLTNPISRNRGVEEFALLRMVSLNDMNMTVRTLPNHYIYNIEQRLQPTEYQYVLKANYRIRNMNNNKKSIDSFRVYTTAVYTVLLVNTKENKLRAILFEDVPPFTVHMLWQIIQYIILSSAEIFVSVTCLIFAYSQAPKRYKVVIMSAWLLTSAFGDLLVVFVAKVRFVENQTGEFIFFAVLMAFATFIFGAIAINYKERKPNQLDEDISEEQHLLMEKNLSN